ncbi:MAG: crosslink repair DNA glycosylase YcaQ family protein [Acidimicrobiales bacterium]
MDKLSALTARRVAIRAHGLSKPRPQGRVDRRHLRKVLDDIGLVQIDSVNVLARSHHLVLYSRLGDHDDSVLTRLADDGSLVEGWVHEASFLPAQHHHLFHWRRDEARRFVGVRPSTRAWVEEHQALIDDVLEQVRDNGPIGAGDLDQRSGRRGPWWGWDEAKIAIEWLFRIGDVGATRGAQFERRYDLMDRVLPEWASREPTDREVAHRELVRLATRHLGVASIGDITDYHRLKKTDVKRHVAELVADGELVEVAVEGWTEPGYLMAHTKPSRTVSQSALVSPFDPLVWHRPAQSDCLGSTTGSRSMFQRRNASTATTFCPSCTTTPSGRGSTSNTTAKVAPCCVALRGGKPATTTPPTRSEPWLKN